MDLLELLKSVRDGSVSVDEAVRRLRLSSLNEVETACLDVTRELRKDVPEIIFAENKTLEDLLKISKAFFDQVGRVVLTRVSDEQADEIKKLFKAIAIVQHDEKSRTMVIKRAGEKPITASGNVAIITAGTADVCIAGEAKVVLEEMGCRVLCFFDVGVAGIHRLFPAIKKTIEEDVDAIIVVAGMEGALPSVVCGLVAVPVIGVPASSGYGLGGNGEGALVSMLQSCSPGLVVVNIDNGVGAAVAAALISKRARTREL
jgi:hypothetical protein